MHTHTERGSGVEREREGERGAQWRHIMPWHAEYATRGCGRAGSARLSLTRMCVRFTMSRAATGDGAWSCGRRGRVRGVRATTGDNFDSRHLAEALGWADFHFHFHFDFFFAFACSLLLLLGKPQNRKGVHEQGDAAGGSRRASQLLSV